MTLKRNYRWNITFLHHRNAKNCFANDIDLHEKYLYSVDGTSDTIFFGGNNKRLKVYFI
jgi:hypothetical protein